MAEPIIDIKLQGDNAWPDLQDKGVIHGGSVWRLVALRGGMASGRTSITLRLDLADGNAVIAETSVRAWLAAADILRANFPED